MKSFSASYNKIKTIPPEIVRLSAITELDLKENSYRVVPGIVGSLTTLCSLDLADSSCKVLEEGIGELFPMIDSGQLTFVDFDNNTFESPPPIVQRRGGTEVVRYMHQFNNLKVVDPRMLALDGFGLKNVPDVIFTLTNLTHLSISHNGIIRVPEGVKNLKSLRKLAFHHNAIKILPEQCCRFTGLEDLQFSSNLCADLPRHIINLGTLQTVDFSANGISESRILADLAGLKDVRLDNNEIKKWPPTLYNWKALQHLSATANEIKSINDEFGEMVSLTNLNLSGNRLSSLNTCMSALNKLKFLGLSRNKLTKLDDTVIQNYDKLEIIWLDQNHLQTLPSSLRSIRPLKEIWAHDNRISALENGFELLPSLTIFTLARNAPNLEIPDELLLKQQLLEEAWGFSSLADAPDEKAPQLRDEVMRILEKPLTEMREAADAVFSGFED